MTAEVQNDLFHSVDATAYTGHFPLVPEDQMAQLGAGGYLDVVDMIAQDDAAAVYTGPDGRQHTTLQAADHFSIELGDDPALAWWLASTRVAELSQTLDPARQQGEVLRLMVRNGWVVAKRGYQSQLQQYVELSEAMAAAGVREHMNDPDALMQLPGFIPNGTVSDNQIAMFSAAEVIA